VLALCHNSQIFWAVITLVAVNVVDYLTGFKWSTYLHFGNNPMLMSLPCFSVAGGIPTITQRIPVIHSTLA
jgi:hypothetical protein